MSAIESGRREQHIANGREVFSAVTEIIELPNGKASRLSLARKSAVFPAGFSSTANP
jgi:hypothetical protein